ncbi:MAG: hypothetical protein ACI8Z5_000871 [Lentimonas sp.]|jgi:hypothetical protein
MSFASAHSLVLSTLCKSKNTMSLISGIFGKVKFVVCDRCGRKGEPSQICIALCSDCYEIPSTTLREEDYCDSGWWKFLRTHSRKEICCSICKKSAPPKELKHVCLHCRTSHPDASHLLSWGSGPESSIGIDYDHCSYCQGVVIKDRRNRNKKDRTYFKVSSKEPSLIHISAHVIAMN